LVTEPEIATGKGSAMGAIDTLIEPFATIPSPSSQQLGNAANRVDATAIAFSHCGALCEWGCLSRWIDLAADDGNIR
jgi:hypothetical protein